MEVKNMLPNVDTRKRIITATITIEVNSLTPEKTPMIAEIRKKELTRWIERHWPDIENAVPSFMDKMTWDIETSIEKSKES